MDRTGLESRISRISPLHMHYFTFSWWLFLFRIVSLTFYVKVNVQVLSLDLKLILATLQFYPLNGTDHWKWLHSYIFELSIFAASLGRTVRLHSMCIRQQNVSPILIGWFCLTIWVICLFCLFLIRRIAHYVCLMIKTMHHHLLNSYNH